MRQSLIVSLLLSSTLWGASVPEAPAPISEASKTVYVIPVRDDIMSPMTYLVRRGVKEAMDNRAQVLILDMETDGGRVDVTEEIIGILGKFSGDTVTYVNRKAFSAGAFIAVATKWIYMAPQSVIGAAAPILMMPGSGVEKIPETLEAKMTSGIKALVRATAKKNGHNPDVIEAMIDRTKELKIDGEVLNKEGQILTLDDEQAARLYGDPAKPLLSFGTVESLDRLIDKLGFAGAKRMELKPTGAERLASWINAISPLLLILGAAGLYIEFKTPGFGLPGIVGIVAFALYFFGGYIAGLAGLEWLAIFILGLTMVVIELVAFPGVLILGIAGASLMLIALVMGMVDVYPGMPALPSLPQLSLPLQDLTVAAAGSILVLWLLSRWLPKTSLYGRLVSSSASGITSVAAVETRHTGSVGRIGVTLSVLRPGGKAQFDDEILDVVAEDGFVDKGQCVRVVGFSGHEAVVQAAGGGRQGA